MTAHIYMTAECDHCQWVEEHLRRANEEVFVWDCKRYLNKDGLYKARERSTGSVQCIDFSEAGFPLMVRYGESGNRAWVGAKSILEELGAETIVFV